MEATGENRCKHHEAPWLSHALLQPHAHAHHHGAHEQLASPWPLADIASIQCHSSAQHPRVHGSYTRIASGLSKSRFPQPTPIHAVHGTTSISMPSSLHRQIPSGGLRSAQFKHRCSEDESKGTHPVHGQNLATHVLRQGTSLFDCGPSCFLVTNWHWRLIKNHDSCIGWLSCSSVQKMLVHRNGANWIVCHLFIITGCTTTTGSKITSSCWIWMKKHCLAMLFHITYSTQWQVKLVSWNGF